MVKKNTAPKNNESGGLVITLDFELLWGVFDKVNYNEKWEYFKATRLVIPKILNLFDKYSIHCTWAVVGMLFNENWEEWESNIPSEIPNYHNPLLSAYDYGNSIKSKETEVLCFAPQLIRQIQNTRGQEIGTHTYSHYYCLESGQTLLTFKADLQKSIELADKNAILTHSLVFPRNQYNIDYLEICDELGIKNVRSNPENWYWDNTQESGLLEKIFRTGDAYAGPKDKSYLRKEIQYVSENIKAQKASRLLRPFTNNKIQEKLKLSRIKAEITKAAKRNEIYHLWWHPHNFGCHPDESLQALEEIVKHVNNCGKLYGFNSYTMDELYKESH